MNKFKSLIFSTVVDLGFPQTIAGPHRIATEIRKLGISCQVIHHFDKFSDEELITILDKMVDNDTLVIGFSTVFWSHSPNETNLLISKKCRIITDYINKNNFDCKIIGGGGSVNILKRYNLSKLDALFEGYAEPILIEYITALKNKTPLPIPDSYDTDGNFNISIYNQRDDSNLFNFAKSKIIYQPEDFLFPQDVASIEVGRGCIFKCKFCAFPLNGKKNLDHVKNMECLKEELIENYEKFQLQHYIIADDTFNDSMDKLISMHKMISTLPFKIKFSCYLRLDLLNAHREQIDILKEMGMAGTFFGVETFHKKAASLIGKNLDSNKAKMLLHDLKHRYWKHEVKIGVGFITGLPGETYESYEETKKWILSEENLIEQIRVAPLHIPNPLRRTVDANESLFKRDHAKYGFYWTDNTNNWKNLNGPVKSYKESQEIADDLLLCIKKTYRQHQGAFGMFQAWRSAKIIDPNITSFQNLIDMDRFQYTKWIHSLYSSPENVRKYYEHYKNNFLKNG